MFTKLFSLILIASFGFLSLFFVQNVANASDDMTKTDFTLNVSGLMPGGDKYTSGTKENVKQIMEKISRTLLVVIPMLAVVFIVIGGVMMITAGASGKEAQFGKGKTIIMYNIAAIAIALLSYSIMQLVAWVLGMK